MSMEESFTKIELNNYDLDRTTRYRCSCGEQVGFQFHDFEKHWKSEFSNLQKGHFVGAPEGEAFIDFYCPQCNVPTTIQYSLSAAGQHGEFWYTIQNVAVGQSA